MEDERYSGAVMAAPVKNNRREKAVNSVLRVLAENELTAVEIQLVLMDVNEAINLRPLTKEFVEQLIETLTEFTKAF